ncbi:MAG: phage tail tape measure protein, partial [Nanoarchaeota archaeon]|nr:phage tail tape measure protein [Nanoarchaeota archaeon]
MRESVAGTAGLASVPGLTEEVKQVESLEEVNRLKKEIALRNKVIQDLNLKIVESQRKERDGVRETTTALKEKEAVVSSIAAKTTPPGGVGGQPPPGGGSVPPIIPIPVVTPLLSREMMLDKSRTFAEISVAMSRYNEVLTGAYLKQTMMGERIDLTAVKMSEYQHVVDKTSSVLAKHVSYQDVQDKKYMENIAVIERLVDVIGKEGKAYDEIKTKQERLQKTREEITFRLGAGELGKELADKAKGSLASLKGTSAQEGLFFKEVSRLTTDVPKGKEIKGLADSGIKLQGTINRLSQGFVDFNTKMTTAMSTGKGTDKVLKEIMATMKANDPIFAAEAAGVKNLEQASQALANAVAREQRAFISNVGTVEQAEARAKEFANGLMVLDEKTQKLTKSTEGFNLGAAKLNLRIRTLKASERELVGDVERVANAYALQTNHLLKLQRESAKTGLGQSAREKLNRKEIEMTTAKVKELAQIYEVLEKGRKGYSDEIAKLGETQRRLDSKTSEHYRGMIRTTLRGFADMMKSQTAWIAGYAVMFGSIRALKSALGSVIEMEHQFARAMRTSRSELMETAEILDRYKSEGVLAMMRFGKTSADVGEILYQMGSAGLKSEEALASLNSTMNMLVATEGEVADTTKMIASIYNNFGDQITSATGLVGKFKYINDIATATFRDHQVEINEYREGLKYLTAMGKVSNLTFLEMSGILGTLNDHMIKSGIAGRSMQSILSRLTKDAYGFAKAFDIPIRLGAPVDLLGILDQISGKMNAGALTAGEVGKVFERLGLRGSQSFVTLLKYMDELRGNIKKLEETSVNASEEMARVMLEKPDVAFARMRETIFALIRLGFEPLVKIAYGAAFGISMVGVKIGEIQGPLSTFLGTIVRLTGMFATLAATSAIFGVIRTKLRPGTADWKTLSEFLEAIKKRFADIGKYAREFYIALRSGQMASASKAFDLLGIKIIGAAWAFKLLLAAIVAYGIYKLVDKLHTSNAEYVAMANNISKVVVQSKEEIDALQKKIKSYENLNRELDRYEEYQQNEAARKLVEKYEADLKSLESITKTIDDMRKKLVKPLVSDKEAYEMIAKLQSQSGVVIAPSEKSVAAMRKAIIKEAIDMIKEMETGWTNSRKAAEATLKEIPKGSRYVGQFTEAINKLREAFNSLTEFKEIGEDLTTEIKNLIDKALELKNALVTPPYEAKIGSWDKLISKEWGISEQGNLTRNLEEQLKLEKEIAHVKMEEGKEVIRGSAYISGIRKETVKEMKKEFLNRVAETLLDVKITGETVELSKEALAIGESLLK